MDLQLSAAAPSDEERSAVDELLGSALPSSVEPDTRVEFLSGRVTRAGQEARARRTMLLPALHALQSRVGWISEGGLNYVCSRLTVPPAEAFGVATFYAMFTVEPTPPSVVHVCDDLACRVSGARELLEGCRAALEPDARVVASPCLGLCDRAPAVLVQKAGAGRGDEVVTGARARVAEIAKVVQDEPLGEAVAPAGGRSFAAPTVTGDRLLARAGVVDPTSLQDYRAHGGYAALAAAVELGGDATIQQVTDARLLGRGGAAFPTGVKWRAVADQPVRERFVICNADESEPGTFKDRVVMEQDPFAVIEALTIAGFATGAETGLLYVRGEYPVATTRLEHAVAECRRAGLLGDDVMGAEFSFDIELRRGAGAYICGEETALFESIEGNRGEPRNKPPFPVTHGVFGKPTSINNVETLLNVLQVISLGVDGYASLGTEGSTGTRLFCLSGHVERPGVYEAEHGITLGDAIDLAGGVRGGASLKAVLLGGAAGGFVAPDRLEVRLSFEDARAGGYTLGSGVVMVFDESTDLVDLCLRIARFFRDESCGQCVPCRVGTVRQEEALHRLASDRMIWSRDDEFALLEDISLVMRDASICGLGQTAATAVQSAIATFGLFGREGS